MSTVTKNWFSRLLVPLLYRSVQRCVAALPASLLRFRPFGVYAIGLPQQTSEPQDTTVDQTRQIKWITTQDEARCLGELATDENIASCNGTTRRAAAVWQAQELVAVVWVAAESFSEDELGLDYHLHHDEVWLFAAVVDPAYRRQGIYRQLLQFLIEELSQTQVKRILLGVSSGNKPSQLAHLRQGAKQLGSIFAMKCLGFVFCKVQGRVKKAPPLGLRWRRKIEITVESQSTYLLNRQD